MFGIENGVSNSTSLCSLLLLSCRGFGKGVQGSISPKEPQNRYGWKRNVDESYFLHVEQKKVTPRVWRVGSSSHHPICAPAGARIPKWGAEGLRVPRSSPVLQPWPTAAPWEAKSTNPHKTLSEGSMPPLWTPGSPSCWAPLPAPLRPTIVCSLGKRHC